MILKRIFAAAFICCAFVVIYCADARAEDWLKKEFEVADGGILEFEFPLSWGKKPEYDLIDGVTNIRFGPYGPKSKPIFLLNVMAGVSTQALNSDQLLEITKIEVEKFRPTAFETDIPISAFQGPHMSAHLFSITDSESKRGEFDYLTAGVVSSGELLVICSFLSNDGAPNFGADAMQMMRSIKYTAPPPPPEPPPDPAPEAE